MKRKSFLKNLITALCALPLLTRRAEAKTDFECLELDYCKACNALTDYRHRNGFEPGARVRAQSRYGGEPLLGVIAPYGESWSGNSHPCVPVLLDKGYRQPWGMDDLTILSPAPAADNGQQ